MIREILEVLAPTPEAAYALGLLLFFIVVPIFGRTADWLMSRLPKRRGRNRQPPVGD